MKTDSAEDLAWLSLRFGKSKRNARSGQRTGRKNLIIGDIGEIVPSGAGHHARSAQKANQNKNVSQKSHDEREC